MQKPLSLMSAFIVPALGLGVLIWALSLGNGGVTEVMRRSEWGCEIQIAPANFNTDRIQMLHQEYQHYKVCCRRLQQARTGRERVSGARFLAEAVQEYDCVAEGTDPSAFHLTSLPKRLLEKTMPSYSDVSAR